MHRDLFNGSHFLFFFSSSRLAAVKEEKEGMAKALGRLQLSGKCSTAEREDWRIRDVVRTLEEQLIKERARSQRSTSKRCQEQRLLVEQVKVFWIRFLFSLWPVWFSLSSFLSS